MKLYDTNQWISMRISTGKGKHQVWLEKKSIGPDFLFILGGGELTHIGGIVLCEPGQPVKIIRLGSHYDYQVLKPIAETACHHYHTTAVAIGGMHIDHATKEDINIILANCQELTNQIEKNSPSY